MEKPSPTTDPSIRQTTAPSGSKRAVSDRCDQTSSAHWDHPDSNWNQAVSHTAQADPFCCRTEWQLSFHEAMRPDRSLVVRETAGSMAAFAEIDRSNRGNLLTPIESGWEFGCPLLGPDSIELLANIIAEDTLQCTGQIPRIGQNKAPTIFVSGLVPGSLQQRQLAKRFGPDFDLRLNLPTALCNASLAGGVDGFLSRRSSSHRRGLRKQARRATLAGITFERASPANQIEATQTYSRMLAVESASWKGIGACGMTVQPSRDFYDCMLRRLAVSESARVIFARHDNKDIGFIFGGMAGKIYRGQQFSFTEQWKPFSIGNLLQLEQIIWLCSEGATRYDMGPMMEYKRHWTESTMHIETLILIPK